MTSFQDFKLREKQISPTFSYFLINNALLYHFLANWLAHNKKMTENSVFREAWSPELTSQSFPVSCFWCRGFVPHRKWNLTLLAHQNTGKENRYRKIFLLHLPAHWGDLIKQIKKSVIYTLRVVTSHTCYSWVCLIGPWCYGWNCSLLIQSNKFITGVKIKASGDSKHNNTPGQ